MLRAAVIILSGNAAAAFLGLVRNIVVAWSIPVEDFGIASTLVLATMIVEMATALGVGQQIVVTKQGDDPQFMAAMQGFQVLRGLVAGAAVFAVAGPLADFLNVPEATWGYRAMALLPVLNALRHMDIARLQRQMVFGPSMIAGLVPTVASIVALWPLSMWLGDWRVMLAAVLLQAVLGLILSHLLARRPYRLAFDLERSRETVRFGWPLLINGALMFLVFNGDRLIVGRELGMAALGIFSMGVTLTLTPTLVLDRSLQSFFLPLLARVDRGTTDGAARFGHLAIVTMQAALLNGVLIILGAVLVGDLAVRVLLGPRYEPLTAVLEGLAILQAVRSFKAGGATVALSRGRTGNAMWSNLVRVASLPIAWVLLLEGWGLEAVIVVAVAAEAAGYALSLELVRRRVGVSLRPLRLPAALTVLSIAGALAPGSPRWATAAISLLLAAAVLASMADLHRYALRRWRKVG